MKLGKLTDEPMTAAEAADLGGLNFTVSFYPVTYTASDGVQRTMTDRVVCERDDTHVPFEVVSRDYKPVQYREAFDFMDQVAGVRYVAAGALQGGRQGFMVVRAPETFHLNLLGSDPHDLYVVLRTSHNRTRALEAAVMPLRSRCMNQLTLRGFSKDAHYRVAVKHAGDVHSKLAEAQVVLTNLGAYAAELNRTAERLAERTVGEEEARRILTRVIPSRPRSPQVVDQIIGLWTGSPAVGWDGTGWGLVNAVSEYFDWQRDRGTPASRFVSALQGQTHGAINRTAGLLLSRVG